MRRAALLAAALAAACSPEPRRTFSVGLVGPVAPRVAAEALRLGLAVSEGKPGGAVVEPAADWATLRFRAARGAASGADGVYFRLPNAPEGRDLLDYPEEWQAVVRAARELSAMRAVLERGMTVPPPFPVPGGLEARAWTYGGRRYVLLVNPSGAGAPLDAGALAPWRALFEVRSDPRQALKRCGSGLCLPAGAALWLEGRLG
jgi:hypothetical protein